MAEKKAVKKKTADKEYTALINIFPAENVKVLAGEKVMLSAKMADHYKKIGAI